MAIRERLKNVWNAFLGRDPTRNTDYTFYGSSTNPTRRRSFGRADISTKRSIFNRIAVDCASANINHVKVNDDGKFEKIIEDSLNYALSKSANIDQSGRTMILDAIFTMLEEGHVAIVPVITDGDPDITDSYKVEEIRVGVVVEWYPRKVLVDLYNDLTGNHEQVLLDKRYVAIVENPFYEIMNEPNSTLQRFSRVLRQLDSMNDTVSSNKLDLIIQLPYEVKGELKKNQAERRRKDVEAQLTSGQYGIAYISGTERVVQLNRSLENNLWTQAKELQESLYNELGLSKTIFDNTADEKTILNYNNRTVEPILTAVTEEMERKWLSRTARTQKQAIRFFKDPFKLVPVSQLAEIADKFTRNEIMTSNEIRSVISMMPAKDPRANQLINSNLNQPEESGNRTASNFEKTKNNNKIDVEEIVARISKS